MAIIGKLMGARPSMSAPRAAPKPAPVSSRPSFDFLTGGQPKQTIPADAFDRDALIQDILSKIQVPSAPVFDPTGLQARLAELEGRKAPVFDTSALEKQIAELQNREAPVFDPSELQKQISDLRQRPSRDDFMSIERQLQDLRNREIPQFDASGLQSQIGGLEERLANIPQFDPSQLQAGIQGLSERISNLPQFDPSALQNRLAELEGRQAPTFNPEDFREQFLNIAREGIDIPQAPTIDREELVRDITGRIKQPRPFDPSRLQERLAALENRKPTTVRELFDPSRLQARLDALEAREPVAPPPAFDPSSLQERLAALENRQPVAPPAFDTSSIDQRFEDIARQLAELQSAQAQPSPDPVVPPVQPLPIQPPGDTDFGTKERAPDIRDFAKPLPGGGTIFDQGPDIGISPPRPPKPVELDFGFGPGIRPSEIITPDGEFVGSGRPTPPISIGGPGRTDGIMFPGGSPTFNERGETFVPPPQPPRVPLSERTDIFGAGKRYDPANLPEGFSFDAPSDGIYNMAMPPLGFVYAYGPDGERQAVPSGEPGAAEMRDRPSFSFGPGGLTPPPPSTPTGPSEIPVADIAPDPVTTPAPVTPPASTTVAANQPPAAPPPVSTIPTPPGTVDPVIMGQVADEKISDPLLRALYFGTPDQPGFFNQLQQVGANLLGAQAPGTEYDPSMTEKFFNPFEDRVVQQTIEDVLKAGEQRDIAQRAQDIGRGGLSAFGSRARLTASERQEDLGRGLAKQLANIRQSGFSEAQRTGLSEFDRQYGRDINQLYRPLDVLRGIGGLLPGYQAAGTNLRTTYGMPSDPSALGLGAAIGAYTSLAPQTGSAFDSYGQTTGQG